MDSGNAVIMRKESHMWVVNNFSSHCRNKRVGEAVSSPEIIVEGCRFTIKFYPQGEDDIAHAEGKFSLLIRNEGEVSVDVACGFEILHQYGLPWLEIRRSLFDDKGMFRRVVNLRPGRETGVVDFLQLDTIQQQHFNYVRRDSIKIRATIGVFTRQPLSLVREPFDPTIFFEVGDMRFFAEESILTKRCPALLSPEVVVSDIEPDLFEAVLWFIYKKKLHVQDKKAISYSNLRDPNSFARRMIVAADRFNLVLLRRLCICIIKYGELHEICFGVQCAFTSSWRFVCGLRSHQS